MLTEPLSRRNAEGQPAYRHSITNINDTAEVGALIRNAFTAQHDGNCVVVLAGPTTNLTQVLKVRGAEEWIERKVKLLVFAGGAYPSGAPDEHIQADIAAAKQLFAAWPSPIIASGREVGEQLLFPGDSIERDFAWSQAHPIVDAYRAQKSMPYDAPTWDMTAVLYAVRPQESYFKLSDPGTIKVLDDGQTAFTPSANGRHRYLIFDPEQRDRIIQTYTEIVSIKPTPRQRFRPPQQ
jgi:inosine-uridine nucleoside N-ribohydrolase